MLISMIFSFKNEEKNLNELIARVRTAVEKFSPEFELIFVNDASTDSSIELLLKEREKDPRIKIINMSRNFGVHPCVFAGLKYSSGDAIIMMDTDLQDPPEVIPELIQKWKAGADVVNTVRTARLGENQIKMWITRQAYRAIDLISEIDLPINMGDFRLISRRVVDQLCMLKDADPFFRGLVRWVGFKQDVVYYVREPRFGGETHFPLFGKGPIKEFIRGITSFSAFPLYLAIFLGFGVTVLSGILILYVLWVKFQNLGVPGWAGPMISTLFLCGFLSLTNGIMGIYIARIFGQVKNRPLYIVDNTIGFLVKNSHENQKISEETQGVAPSGMGK